MPNKLVKWLGYIWIGVPLLIIGCGKGSDTGIAAKSDLNPSLGTASGLTLSIDTLNFAALNAALPPTTQSLTATISGGASAIELRLIGSNGIGNWLNIAKPTVTDGRAPIIVSIKSSGLTDGKYTATLRVIAVRADQTAIAFRDVAINYTVGQAASTPTSTSTTISFEYIQSGSFPPSQAMTIQDLTANYATIDVSPYVRWLSYSVSNNTLTLSLNSNLYSISQPNDYSTTVTIVTPNSTQQVTVNLKVLSATPHISVQPNPPLAFVVGATSTSSDLSKALTLSSNETVNWGVSPDTELPAWLTLGASKSGTTEAGKNTLEVALNVAELNKLTQGNLTSSIKLNYWRGAATPIPSATPNLSLSITLALTLPGIDFVAPYVALENTPNQRAILRGRGLSNVVSVALSDTTTGTVIQTISGTDVTRALNSDAQLTVNLPTLTTGTYTVLPVFSTGNTLGLTVHGASLSVAAAPTPPTSGKFVALPALPTGATRKPLDIIYDAERSRVLVGLLYPNTPTKPSDAGDISQYNLGADSSLTLDTTVHTPGYEPIANLKNIALSTDGKSIVAITTFGDVFQLDANSLANQRHITSTFSFNGLAMSNDGTALLTSSSTNGYSNIYTQRYALSDGTLTSLNNGNQYYIGQSDPVSSGDGSTIFYSAKQNNLNNYVRYQSLNGAMDTPSGMTSLVGFTSAVDKHATRVVFSTTGNTSFSVITFNPSKSLAPVALPNTNIGSLLQPSIAAPSAPVRVALSPSGDKAYFCCNSFTPTGGVKNTYVRACDLTIYSAVTGYKCVDTAIVADPGTGVSTGNGYKMAIAPDGGTLFILGDTNIVVLPTSTLLQ